MNYLLDTNLLLWSMTQVDKVPAPARALIESSADGPYYSVISIWEVAIKYSLQRPDFTVDPQILRRALDDSGFLTFPVSVDHAIAAGRLPLNSQRSIRSYAGGASLCGRNDTAHRRPCPGAVSVRRPVGWIASRSDRG